MSKEVFRYSFKTTENLIVSEIRKAQKGSIVWDGKIIDRTRGTTPWQILTNIDETKSLLNVKAQGSRWTVIEVGQPGWCYYGVQYVSIKRVGHIHVTGYKFVSIYGEVHTERLLAKLKARVIDNGQEGEVYAMQLNREELHIGSMLNKVVLMRTRQRKMPKGCNREEVCRQYECIENLGVE